MKQISVAGSLYQPFGSFPAVSQSDDGVIWDPPSSPFPVHTMVTCIANDGTNVAVGSSQGYISISSNLTNWNQVEIFDGFGISGIGHKTGLVIAAGTQFYIEPYGPYPGYSEVAQIYTATSFNGPWAMSWSHPSIGSRIYQIRRFILAPITHSQVTNVWVICGEVNGYGDAWYSTTDGASWTRIPVPDRSGRIYSVELAKGGTESTWYWGCKGNVFKSTTLDDPEWTEIVINDSDTVVDMVSDPTGNLVISGTNTIYVARDGIVNSTWSEPGYVFDRVAAIEQYGAYRWIAFARSTLTHHTAWYSDDLITWNPINGNIHVAGSTILA